MCLGCMRILETVVNRRRQAEAQERRRRAWSSVERRPRRGWSSLKRRRKGAWSSFWRGRRTACSSLKTRQKRSVSSLETSLLNVPYCVSCWLRPDAGRSVFVCVFVCVCVCVCARAFSCAHVCVRACVALTHVQHSCVSETRWATTVRQATKRPSVAARHLSCLPLFSPVSPLPAPLSPLSSLHIQCFISSLPSSPYTCHSDKYLRLPGHIRALMIHRTPSSYEETCGALAQQPPAGPGMHSCQNTDNMYRVHTSKKTHRNHTYFAYTYDTHRNHTYSADT